MGESIMAEMNMDTVSLSRLKKLVEQLERQKTQFELTEEDDLEVAFEYIIGSLFPRAYQNMKDTCRAFYIEGYNKGQQECHCNCNCNCNGECKKNNENKRTK
jgi:hypothetical protein